MKTKKLFGILFLGAVLVLSGCGEQAATEPPQGEVIFLADPPEVQMGNCTMLVWDASSAFEVRLDGELVTLVGNREVCPTETTIYILEADLGTSVEHRELEVRVIGAEEQASKPGWRTSAPRNRVPASNATPKTAKNAPTSVLPSSRVYGVHVKI
jgi:hypothetical protein